MTRLHTSTLLTLLRRCTLAALMVSGLCSPILASAGPVDEHKTASTRLQEIGNKASDVAMQAINLLGIRYKYGGNEPETGLDCSGLVRFAFKEAWGKDLPRTAREISKVGEKVDNTELKPGDLVFYNTLRRGFSHVGIYLGDNKFIHSPSSGGEVRIESMDITYWKKRFMGARRIEEPEGENKSSASNAASSASQSSDKKS